MSSPTSSGRRGWRPDSRRERNLIPNYLILTVLSIFAIGPMLITIFNSLKSPAEAGRNPLGVPSTLLWRNYSRAWETGHFSTTIPNSGILVVLTVTGVLTLGGMAAYSLAKLEVPGGSGVILYLLVGSTLPLQLYLVPLFFLWKNLGLTNSLPGLALIYIAINSPLAVILLRSYMVQLPRDFEDAARVDGAGEMHILLTIVVPLSWPGLLTVGLIVALSVWNEFLLATVFLTKQELATVVTSYANFSARYSRDWSLTSAAAVMMMFPVIAIFLLLQRRFVEGLTQGGLKG